MLLFVCFLSCFATRPLLKFVSMSLNNVLPHSTARTRVYGAKPLPLLDPNDPLIAGPCVTYRNPSAVSSGLLAGWDADAARSFLSFNKPVDCWDVSWGEEDRYFVEMAHTCSTPEEVEEMLPVKWVGYRLASAGGTGAVDETLSRVCKLCTALVDKFTLLAQDDNRDQSASKWRLHQTLLLRLKAVMTLLEASIGESIPILKLKDPEFVRSCWQRMGDNDRNDVFSTLSSSETTTSASGLSGQRAFPPTAELEDEFTMFADENSEPAATAFHRNQQSVTTTTTAGPSTNKIRNPIVSFADDGSHRSASKADRARSSSVVSVDSTGNAARPAALGEANTSRQSVRGARRTVVQRRY